MSHLQDLKRTLNQNWLKEKLTIRERAQLFIDISEDFEEGIFTDLSGVEDINAAMAYLNVDFLKL